MRLAISIGFFASTRMLRTGFFAATAIPGQHHQAVDALIFDRRNDGDIGFIAAQRFGALRWHRERKIVTAGQRAVGEAPHQRRGVEILDDGYSQLGHSVLSSVGTPKF